MIFPAGDTFFEFILIWECFVLPVLQLLLGVNFIMVDTGFITCDILWQKTLTSGSVVMQKIRGCCLPCVFVHIHQGTDLVIAKLFSNCRYSAFTDGWGEWYFISSYAVLASYQSLNPTYFWALLQCRWNHCTVCHDVLLILFQIL
jgi:hypothetical protein